MANRIMLNETSYHGSGAINEIATEAKAHGFKKAFVCSDPDLIKFNVTSKVTDILDKMNWLMKYIQISRPTQQSKMYNMAFSLLKIQVLIILLQLAVVLQWIHQKQSE